MARQEFITTAKNLKPGDEFDVRIAVTGAEETYTVYQVHNFMDGMVQCVVTTKDGTYSDVKLFKGDDVRIRREDQYDNRSTYQSMGISN